VGGDGRKLRYHELQKRRHRLQHQQYHRFHQLQEQRQRQTRIFRRFFGGAAQAQQLHPRDSMAKVKLGSKEFDVDSEEINATCCGVTDADCVALAARMKSGEMRRLKILYLVRLFPFFLSFVECPQSPPLIHYFTGQQYYRRRRHARHFRRDSHQQQCAGAGPCAYVLSLNRAARLFQFSLSFVEFPPSPPLIHIISQGSNNIGTVGTRAIADAMRTNSSVQSLGFVRMCCR
jgi:hypothetical protein